jgi:putative aminopeptidase FrvX
MPKYHHAVDIANTCAEYLKKPSVIGFEEPFFKFLERSLKKVGCEVESLYNRYGRRVLMAVSNCQFDHRKIVSAHVDRHGLYKILDPHLVYYEESDHSKRDVEYAAHAIRRINFDKEEFNERLLHRVSDYFLGETITAYHPVTHKKLLKTKVKEKNMLIDDVYLTFSLKDLSVLDDLPFPFIPLAFTAPSSVTEDGMVSGQIDNAISVAVIHELFKNNIPFTALLTTDEEIGESWLYLDRYFSKYNLEPKNLLVLDTSPYREEHGLHALHEQGSIVLRYTDNYAAFNRGMTQEIRQLADELSIPHDFKDLTLLKNGHAHLGNTELGKLIMKSQGKYNGSTLQVPTDEYHTNRETTSLSSLENCFLLAAAYLKQ